MEANFTIYRRSGHVAVAYKNNMIIWGGYMEANEEVGGGSKYHSSDEIWIYNTVTDIWIRGLTKGNIPPRSSGSCGVVFDDSLYVFAGYYSDDDLGIGNSNKLYRLNLNTLVWELLLPEGPPPSPCDKLVGWLYKEKLYFFGGFGSNLYPNNSRYSYIVDTNTVYLNWPRGWNNQFVCYNVAGNAWEWPTTYGPKPGPRAAHAADISGSLVCLFGGRTGLVRNNEVHILDMQSMTWSGDLKTASSEENRDWPEGRSWCSLTFVTPDSALMYGGLNQYNVVLSDCWRLYLRGKSSLTWQQCMVNGSIPLLWHKATFFPCNNEIYILGGFKKCVLSQLITWRVSCGLDHADTVLVIPFSPKSLLRLCLDFIVSNEITYQNDRSLPGSLINIIELRKLNRNSEITTILMKVN